MVVVVIVETVDTSRMAGRRVAGTIVGVLPSGGRVCWPRVLAAASEGGVCGRRGAVWAGRRGVVPGIGVVVGGCVVCRRDGEWRRRMRGGSGMTVGSGIVVEDPTEGHFEWLRERLVGERGRARKVKQATRNVCDLSQSALDSGYCFPFSFRKLLHSFRIILSSHFISLFYSL